MDVIRGVFSTTADNGSGKKPGKKTYWLVREQPDGTFAAQAMNRNFVPMGENRTVAREEFLARFEPEPEFYVKSVAQKKLELDDILGLGVGGEQNLPLAGMDFGQAQRINEENITANFNQGMLFLDAGNAGKAQDVFQRILDLTAPFEVQHKHLFNSLGIRLRKRNLFDLALRYYDRAANLAPDDENIHHNMARALFEKGEIKMAMDRLMKSLEINPSQHESKRFVRFLKNRYLGPSTAKVRVFRKPFED